VTIAHGAGRLIATLVRLVLALRHIAVVHIAGGDWRWQLLACEMTVF
jgi:hypothetical protein